MTLDPIADLLLGYFRLSRKSAEIRKCLNGVTFNPALVVKDWGAVISNQSFGLDVSDNTVPGTYAIVFTAEASDPNGNGHVSNYPTTHTVTLNLTVTAEENFSLQLGQSSFTFPLNNVSLQTQLTLVPSNGFEPSSLLRLVRQESGASV
jgi:hypothetical protein